jgi:hypothetical protein
MATEAELIQALRRADAAGDTAAAQAIARRIQTVRQQGQPAPTAPAPAPRTTAQGFGRAAGLLGRDVLEGAGGLVGIVTDPLVYGAGAATGQNFAGMKDTAGQFADALGLPKPETGTERVVSDIQQAVTGGAGFLGGARNLIGAASPLVSSVGQSMAAQPTLQLVGSATGAGSGGIVREAGGTPGAQVGASLLGALAPTAGVAGTSEVLRRSLRGGEAGRLQMRQNIDAFSTAGASPTLGQASPGNAAKVVEARLRGAPGSVGLMAERLNTQAEDIGRSVNQLADSLSPSAGAEKGGRAVIRGITGDGGFMERFRATSGALYDEVERLLPPSTTVPAQSSVEMLRSLTAPVQGAQRTAKVLQNAKVANIARAFADDLAENNGQLPYASLKALRTEVGNLMDDSALSPDVSVRQLSRLYGAMTEDMTRAAVATGDPATIRAANRANMFYRVGQARVEALQAALSREAGGPEAVYRAMFNNSREGGTTIRRVMQSLAPQQQKDFAAATLRRLGRANPSNQDDTLSEVFSTERFLTNLASMSPQARSAIFDRFGPQFRRDLERITAATARIRQANEVAGNPSGSGQAIAQFTAYGGLGLSALSLEPTAFALISGALASSNLAGRAFTNPRIVNWMATQTQAPTSALPAAITQLQRIAETDEDAAALLEEINRSRQQATTPPRSLSPAQQPPGR